MTSVLPCSAIDEAVRLLQQGELVAFPTETVYGLGADAGNAEAVSKIFAAKGRPADHPLIVHLPGGGHLGEWATDIPSIAWELAEAFWPGPLTLILKRAPCVPLAVTGGQDTVGVRVPAHPVALNLLRAFLEAGGGKNGLAGLAAPSANRFGRISPTQAEDVRAELGGAVPLVLDGGACPVGIESTILDLSRGDCAAPRILRPGRIIAEDIEALLGCAVERPVPKTLPVQSSANIPRVSGSLDAHYAPHTRLLMVDSLKMREMVQTYRSQGLRVAVLLNTNKILEGIDQVVQKSLPSDVDGYAHGLYGALRQLDSEHCDVLLVESIPMDRRWSGVADRLRRAAVGSAEANHQ